jgi:SAM-dependent methyltransferase
MSDVVVPHEVKWTPERVQRFWNYYSSNPGLQDSYFARMAGASLLGQISKRIKIGTAVDIGCGPGDLVKLLLDRGYEAYAADSSLASIEKVKGRFSDHPRFRGGVHNEGITSLPESLADTAFMLEVVEHMDDAVLHGALAEARRLLRAGGNLVITTPNEENLEQSKVICPECACIFHRVQHVRSWSAASLEEFMSKAGFETIACYATTLSPYGAGVLDRLYRAVYPSIRRRRPHLIYIGRRSQD